MEGEVGFEPTERYERSSVFKTEAINHSTTHPIVNTILKHTHRNRTGRQEPRRDPAMLPYISAWPTP